MAHIDTVDYFVETPFIDDEDDLQKLDARDRFDREDHYAHVLAGWEHHYTTAHIDTIDHFVETPFIDDEDDLSEWEAHDRFNREDHHAHVQLGWEHQYATAHLEPNIDLPF